ncbi:glycosyltransferase family 2 protein [Vallitalea maricola]|uniref:Uncharacterized protein n=1 Tax=Vallitalea maricola TaxID=3074433 RepID=A0ACB5UN14_9FIRM|nr:hypothetical protein AN2V17_25310 [Vallitalea sp. AN17-2]
MIKNKIIISKILEIVDTLIEASEYLNKVYVEHNYFEFEIIFKDMVDSLNAIYDEILMLKNSENVYKMDIMCENIIYSFNRLKLLYTSRSLRMSEKIEFEVIPLLIDMKLKLYFFSCIYPNKTKMIDYYSNEMINMCSNKFIDRSEEMQSYKYDISIIITGYNKLDYTKLCIDSLLKNIPKGLTYELILVNHGSSDGTKEYFESISPTKQLDICKNGVGLSAVYRIVEGKYVLSVSNDVLIANNTIQNMIACMESDNSIAWVVPSTPNISNLQQIFSDYKSIDEMYNFALQNNKRDKFRWEQRAKLCNPIDLKRSKVFFSMNGIGWGGYLHTFKNMSFPDDKLSFLLRRNGYKMMLAKDAYCYHFGSITLKNDISKYVDNNGNKGFNAYYLDGRKEFLEIFGIDPWGVGFCWEPDLFKYLPCNEINDLNVLGINCGIGSNPLKVKESIKENVHNLKVKIYNITDEHCYIQDLKGVSDIAEYVPSIEDLNSFFSNEKFKYIIIESKFETYENPLKILDKLKNNIVEDGILAIKIQQKELKDVIKLKFNDVIESGQWMILKSF